MGACDMVPGVSGWTIALITWIYEKLLSSIKNILDIQTIKDVFSWKIMQIRSKVSWTFLIKLFLWIITSILLFSHFLESLIEDSPELVWWFFLWLVVASIIVLLRKEIVFSSYQIVWLLVWCGVAFFIWKLQIWWYDPVWWYIILSASVAISAMILPWISWSFLLLILWMYKPLISAINDGNILFLLLFMVGALIGLALFSRLISYLITNYRRSTLSILIWFMIWSLPILWPWQSNNLVWEGASIVMVSPLNYEKQNTFFIVLFLFVLWFAWGYKVFNNFDQVNYK